MPRFNITINETAPVQKNHMQEYSKFSTTEYWSSSTDEIDMTDSRNNIQKYITAYQTALRNMGANNAIARIAKISEVNSLTDLQRNPGQDWGYWIGSSSGRGFLYVLYAGYGISDVWYDFPYMGVRPVVEIPLA